jgi:hypothetical protein
MKTVHLTVRNVKFRVFMRYDYGFWSIVHDYVCSQHFFKHYFIFRIS